MSTPRVFIPQEPMRRDRASGAMVPMIDLRPAEKFGELVRLLEPGRAAGMNPRISLPIIIEKLGQVTANDYLVPVGQPTVIAWTAIYMAAKTARIKMLVWDDKYGHYDVVDTDLLEFIKP